MARPALVRKKHDPQKDAVYKWQWKWFHWNHNELSKDEVRNWVKWAYKKRFSYRHMPTIKYLKGGKASYFDEERNVLAFLYDHRNHAIGTWFVQS